jgi:hypothetical protein
LRATKNKIKLIPSCGVQALKSWTNLYYISNNLDAFFVIDDNMAQACRSCNQFDFVVESYERICTTCGEVQEELPGDEGCLQALPDHQTVLENLSSKKFDTCDRLTGRIRGETQSSYSRRRICKAKALDEMLRVVRQLIKEPSAVDETMDLMSSTFQAYQKRMLATKKNGLAGACIYYLSAKHQLGISLADICKALNIRMKVINVCLKEVKTLCPNFEYERPNIRDLVKKFVDKIASKHYDSPHRDSVTNELSLNRDGTDNSHREKTEAQPLIDSKDKRVLENRVMLLLDLFEAMHPYKQPSPHSLITAVIYHAWKSLDTFKAIASNLKRNMRDMDRSDSPPALIMADEEIDRMRTTAKHSIGYERFCELCDLKYSSNGHKIVTKLQSSLLVLGRHLGDVNKINLPWYLEDIIENSPHLIMEHKRTEPLDLPRASGDGKT